MNGPKPIETVYRGLRFRSRLEARWAVFFDALGIKYVYKPEGYKPDELWYLPDFLLPDLDCWFRLPDLDCWIEVKEQPFERGDETYEKARRLAAALRSDVVVFCGQIEPVMGGWCFTGSEEYCPGPSRVWWFPCPVCRAYQVGKNMADLPCGCVERAPGEIPEIVRAFDAARQACFEHGERGAPR